MRATFTVALNVAVIAAAFAWAWFSGELMEQDLVYLPKDE